MAFVLRDLDDIDDRRLSAAVALFAPRATKSEYVALIVRHYLDNYPGVPERELFDTAPASELASA